MRALQQVRLASLVLRESLEAVVINNPDARRLLGKSHFPSAQISNIGEHPVDALTEASALD